MPGVLATLRPRADEALVERLPAGDTRPEPGLLEQAGAAVRVEADRVEQIQETRRARAFAPLIEALVERGLDRAALTHGQPGLLGIGRREGEGAYRYDVIWREARRLGIEGLPESQEDFERAAYRRQGARDEDLETMARGGGVAGTLAQLGGGMLGSFADPINVYTLPIGGAGKTIAARVLAEAAVGASIEAAQAAGPNRQAYARMGEDYGLAEAAQDIGLAAAGAGAFRGAFELAPGIDAAGRRALAPLRERLDRIYRDRDLARALAKVPADRLTPEQAAARAVFARELEIDEASPYARTYAGDDAHRARLAEASEALAQGRVAGGFDMGRYLARTRSAESGGDDGAAARGSSAVGRYQFVEGTWLEFYRRAFGETGESRAAILARRGDGAVQERVMRSFTQANVDALRRAGVAADEGAAYLAHFLGVGDAIRVLRAAPDAPVAALVTRASIAANQAVFRGIGSASELVAWARRKMGGSGVRAEGVPVRAGDAAPPEEALGATLEGVAAEEADIELARLRAEAFGEEMVELMRPLLRNRSAPINRPATIAAELGLEEHHITAALDRLVDEGALTRTRGGVYRRQAREGPEDVLLFLARRGGVAEDGLGPKARELGYGGHDLRNTYGLDHFVPRGGPLLRRAVRELDEAAEQDGGDLGAKETPRRRPPLGLDEAGEQLWDAGYLGPPETTPRPTEAEVIDILDRATRGEKIYSFFENAPARGPQVREGRFQSDAHENFERERWGQAAERAFGRELTDAELFEALEIARDMPEWGSPHGPYGDEALEVALGEMVNRRLDAALEDAFAEVEDEFYDALAWQFAADAARGEDQSLPGGGAGPAPLSRDAPEGGDGGGDRPGDARPDALDPAARDALEAGPQGGIPDPDNPALARFDDSAGEGVRAVAESDWHDIRAAGEDPAVAARQRQELELRAASPLRGFNRTGQEQDGIHNMDLTDPNLFDAVDQSALDLGDGQGPRSLEEIEAEFIADRAAIEALRKCL